MHILVAGDGFSYCRPFRKFGEITRDQGLLRLGQIDLVVFTGGADISPSLYQHLPSNLTSCQPHRDVYEMLIYRRAREQNIPMAGICRGAQFLCAMAGGTLVQHVNGHSYGHHKIETWDGRKLYVNSLHHQMQNPPEDAEVLAWASPRISDVYIGENDEEIEPPELEYECVYYPKINALGMQYHPECMPETSDGFRFSVELIERFLLPN